MWGGGQVEAPENMKAGHDTVGGVVTHLHQPFRNLEQGWSKRQRIQDPQHCFYKQIKYFVSSLIPDPDTGIKIALDSGSRYAIVQVWPSLD